MSQTVPEVSGESEDNLTLKLFCFGGKVFWSVLGPIFGGLFSRERSAKSDTEMGTVLSFSPRDKTPPYAMEYSANSGHNIHNNHYSGYSNNQQRHYSKENILLHNNNASMADGGGGGNGGGIVLMNQADKTLLEKGMKKHNMFLNALSWKRFTGSSSSAASGTGKRKSGDGGKAGLIIAAADKENHVSSHVISAAGGVLGRNPGNHVAPFSRQALDNVHPMVDNNKNIQVRSQVRLPGESH